MTSLEAPGLPDDQHPRMLHHHNLLTAESITWYSESASADVLVDYVLGLHDLARHDLRSTPAGFAMTADDQIMFAALAGPAGVCLTAFGFEGGAERINAAVSREWELMRDELGRGVYQGNPASAHWAPLVRGVLPEDYAGSPVFDFINGADVVPIRGALPARPPVPEPLAYDAWDDAKVGAYLDADADVVSWTAVSETMFQVRVRVQGLDGAPPIPLMVSTGLNDLMVIVLANVEDEHLGAAVEAVGDIGVVGVARMGDLLALRYGAFKASSDMMALVNGLQAVGLAYARCVAATHGSGSSRIEPPGPVPPGSRVPLAASGVVEIDLDWSGGALDVSAFVLDVDGRVLGDPYFVFYNQPAAPDASVRVDGAPPRRFVVDLDRLDRRADRVAVAVSSDEAAGTTSMVGITASARVTADATTWRIDDLPAGPHAGVLVATLSRADGAWELEAVGTPVAGGLAAVASGFGVVID